MAISDSLIRFFRAWWRQAASDDAMAVDEGRLHRLELELHGRGFYLAHAADTVPVIADVRQPLSLERAFVRYRPDIVFHTAALKHVALLEEFPSEGVETNVYGTTNIVEAAAAHNVGLLVNVSTDKAADPTSILGATKRLAERSVRSCPGFAMRTASVRFGNVLGSRGSFYDTLRHQMTRNQAVTLTHPDVTRYFMTIPEAAGLVITAGTMAEGGEVYVLDMGQPVRMSSLIDRYCQLAGLPAPEVEIIGLGPGEKLNEDLFSRSERSSSTQFERIWRVDTEPDHEADADLDARIEELIMAARQRDTWQVHTLLRAMTPTLCRAETPPEAMAGASV
ncbi:MAG: polysaccharide biosynthesis protein [Cellulomonas sp.]|jgi:FlaA1/EpsC-like NDP-sugar epimerase|nr:polysaccharide biosynthesis protein [Cellulomonas sp.]